MNFLVAQVVVEVVEAVVVLPNIRKSNDQNGGSLLFYFCSVINGFLASVKVDSSFSIFFAYAIMINNGI